jgi:hypothetical protein
MLLLGGVDLAFIGLLRSQNEAGLVESIQIVRPTGPQGGTMHHAERLVGRYGVHLVEVLLVRAEEDSRRRRIALVSVTMSRP